MTLGCPLTDVSALVERTNIVAARDPLKIYDLATAKCFKNFNIIFSATLILKIEDTSLVIV